MNVAVRAVSRTAFSIGWQVMKVESGYNGHLEGDISPSDRRKFGSSAQRTRSHPLARMPHIIGSVDHQPITQEISDEHSANYKRGWGRLCGPCLHPALAIGGDD